MKRTDTVLEPSQVMLERQVDLRQQPTLLLQNGGVLDLGTVLNLRLYNTVPTFESYAICRNYAAKLTVKVECAGKAFDADFKWKPVIVLPKEIERPEIAGDDESGKELSRASSMSVMSFGGAVELGAVIVEGVMEAVSNLS